MSTVAITLKTSDLTGRAAVHLAEAKEENYKRADHLFARLMVVQWLAGIAATLLLSPRTWAGASSQLHPHVIAAIFLGGAITALPVYLACAYSGKAWTRHVVAVAQMLMSSLFVHLSGGRIETHFHVFGSLAFIAFYRDWRVLMTATVVVGLDHALRGMFWPQTVYGVLSTSNWRTLEHVGWVAFVDIVLWISMQQSVREMTHVAGRQAALEDANDDQKRAEEDLRRAQSDLEQRVVDRTADLAKTNETLQAEISERKRAEWQLNIQYAVSRVLTESSTLKEASAGILQTVCENLNWEVGEFYTVDRRAGVMRFDDMWSAPNAQIDAFITLSRQTTFARGIGLPGRVWASGKPIWISDVDVDENFPRASAAKQVGLHGAFSFPILTGNEVSGVIEFFSREIRQPDEELLRMFAVLGSQLGQFFERKRAEEALRESEARYRRLFEANPLPMWVYDLETLSFLEINGAAISHYGYRREEFLSMTISDIHPTADKPRLLANVARAADHTVENAGVWRHRKKDGSLIDVEITSHVLDYGGRRAKFVSAFDITERKAADKALQETEEKYRSIFEHSNDGIFQNTPEGRFLSANPALARMLGFDSPEELIRERGDIERQGYADPVMRAKFKQALEENGFITGFEYEVYRKDGARIWVAENSRIVRDAEGRALYYEGSVQDITERKRAEAERQVISEIVQGVIDDQPRRAARTGPPLHRQTPLRRELLRRSARPQNRPDPFRVMGG